MIYNTVWPPETTQSATALTRDLTGGNNERASVASPILWLMKLSKAGGGGGGGGLVNLPKTMQL